MTRPIAPFTDREKKLVAQCIAERYGQEVPAETADAELQLDPLKEDLTRCPTLTWTVDNAHFVIFKTGDSRFRCQFYYGDVEQFGTNKEEYDTLGDCALTLLQVQADHALMRKGIRSGMNAVDFSKANDGEEVFPPLIV